MVIKYCFVPLCTNNSYNTPKKLFIYVPLNPDIRKKWYEAIKHASADVPKTKMLYCCEDHFHLESDADNWMQYKMIGTRLLLKKDVVPHLRIDEPAEISTEILPESQLTSSTKKRKAMNLEITRSRRKLEFCDTASTSTKIVELPSPSGKFSVQNVEVLTISRGCQADIKKSTKNRGVTANLTKPGVDKEMQVKICPCIKPSGTLPVLSAVMQGTNSPQTPSSISTVTSTESGSYESSDAMMNQIKSDEMKKNNLNYTLHNIKSFSRFYLGLPESEYFLIDFMAQNIKISVRNILICLKKIRLNDPYVRLGIDFGLSSSAISKIFTNSLTEICNVMQELIHWPAEFLIKMNLPTQFVTRYKNVQSIIDCLEIQIEQPTNATHQAQTWSQYKKCNTIKYLISSTPSGLVNFISVGYGGRATDKQIVEESGFINELPENCTVMADRGFKSIEYLLNEKKCKLVRPPSVSADVKMTKDEVLESKRIAALRIHIERVIRRLREFAILAPHACVHTKLVPWLDYIIIVACGIINVQGLLIK